MIPSQRVVLVTGGSSGIGLGIAQACLDGGDAVAIIGRDEAKGIAARDQLAAGGGTVHFVAADLGDELVAQVVVDEVIDRFGRLDVVVNNAGMGTRRSPITPDDGAQARLRVMLANNLEPAYYVSVAALRYWAKHPGEIGRAHV